MFELNFLNTALIAGISASIAAGLLGSLMYAFGESVKSEMFAHVSLAGVGAGIFLGINPIVGAVCLSAILSVFIGKFTHNTRISKDALFMLTMNGGLALALVFNGLSEGSAISFENYLFGSILTLTSNELLSFCIMCLVICVFCLFNWNRLSTLVFDEEFFMVKNKKNSWMKAIFNILVAVFVAGSLKIIGGLLVSGLLVIAVLASQFLQGGFLRSTINAILINVLCVVAGIAISYFVDVSASAAIILSLIASYSVLGLVRSNK